MEQILNLEMEAVAKEELKILQELETHKDDALAEIEREKANPSPRKNILEEFKNRKQKIEEKKKMVQEQERTETAGSRPGGRFTGRTTPRGGTIHLAKGVKAQRHLKVNTAPCILHKDD